MNKIKIGDYVLFGKYKGEKILWRVVNSADESLMLFSEKIISYKSFDGKNDSNYTKDSDKINYGSNLWDNSDIRVWLNSEAEIINYIGSVPNSESVWSRFNAYDKEPGFLYEFTNLEKLHIMSTEHDCTLSKYDSNLATSGKEYHEFEDAYPDIAHRNFDDIYKKSSTDKVFLLSLKEVYEYVQDRGFEWIRKPTETAKKNEESREVFPWYWLRTPVGADSHGVRVICIDGYVAGRSAYRSAIGVVPAINIKENNISIYSGSGTLEDPFNIE